MNPIALEDTDSFLIGTSSPTTAAATNADSTPTVVIEEDGVAMGYSPPVANVAAGVYRVTIVASAANGFEAGKRYSMYAEATVGGVTGRDGVGSFEVLAESLNTLTARVDVAVSTRGTGDATSAAQTTIIAYVDELESRLTAGRAALLDNLALLDAAVSSRAAAGDAMTLTAGAVDSIFDEIIEGAVTMRMMMRGYASALMAKSSGLDLGAGTFRDLADTKNRIVAAHDANGNRTSVTLDLT